MKQSNPPIKGHHLISEGFMQAVPMMDVWIRRSGITHLVLRTADTVRARLTPYTSWRTRDP